MNKNKQTKISLTELIESNIDNNLLHNTIIVDKNNYYVDYDNAIKKEFYISNSYTTKEKSDSIKYSAIYLENVHNLTIDGNGSKILALARMNYITLRNCSNIIIKNFEFGYTRPTTTEFQVISINKNFVDVVFNNQTPCTIKDSMPYFLGNFGEDLYEKASLYGLVQEYNPQTNVTRRLTGLASWKVNAMDGIVGASQISDDIIRLQYNSPQNRFKVGNIYQLRNLTRDHCGFFVENSTDIIMQDCKITYMHGLGFVGQCSQNVTIERCDFLPDNNRTTCSFADMIHFIGTKGNIRVSDCKFDGTHDDVLNVHGIHCKVKKVVDNNTIIVSFMHPEAYGFDYYKVGDEIVLVNSSTLLPISPTNVVTKSERINLFDHQLTLDKPIKKSLLIKLGLVVVENLTANNSNVVFENNHLQNVSTRGILLTNGNGAIVRNNVFEKTSMSAILVADDAKSWYESGAINGLVVENNIFNQCEEPVIKIFPENIKHKGYIHSNITIQNNTFNLKSHKVLLAKSTKNILIKDNKISNIDSKNFCTKNCSNVDCRN